MAQIPKDVGISNNGNNEIIYYLLERVKHYREMIQRTYMTQIKYRECHILQPNETNSAIEELNEIILVRHQSLLQLIRVGSQLFDQYGMTQTMLVGCGIPVQRH